MTPEQQRALAIAAARKRQAEAMTQPQLTPSQQYAKDSPIERTLGRTARAGLTGLASLTDIGLLVPKTASLAGSLAADKMGFTDTAQALGRFGATPTMAETTRTLIDEATENKLQDINGMEKAASFGGELIAGAVPLTQAPKAAGMLQQPTIKTAVTSMLDPETALNQFPQQAGAVIDSPMLRQIATRPNVSLIEKNPSELKRLARGAAQYPSGSKVAEEYFDKKIGMSGERIKSGFSKLISGKTDYYQALDDIVKTGQSKVAPLYQEAFKANKSVASPLIDRILQTPRGRASLLDAVDQMGDQMALVGVPDKELGDLARELSDLGKMDYPVGGVAKGLKLETLDKIKKGFDATWKKAKQAGDREEASRINNLRKQFVSEIDRLDTTGLYAKARKEAGDYLTNESAAESGVDIFKADKELLVKQVSDMSKTEKESFKVGVAKAMRDSIDNLSDGRNPFSKTFGNPAIREKLAATLSKDEFARLEKTMSAENELYKLRNFVLGGSQTTGKAIDAAQFSSELMDTAQQAAQYGWKNVGASKVVNFVKGIATGMSDEKAGQVAKILFEEDPKIKVDMLQKILGNKDGGKEIAKAYFKIEKQAPSIAAKVSNPLLTQQGASALIGATGTQGTQMIAPPMKQLPNYNSMLRVQ